MPSVLAHLGLLTGTILSLSAYPVPSYAEQMVFSTETQGGNCGTCDWIQGDGEITTETPRRFREFVEQQGIYDGETIFLNSPGGEPRAAAELGREFRKHSLRTKIGFVPGVMGPSAGKDATAGHCVSACVFAFIGGARRSLMISSGMDDVKRDKGAHRFAIHRFSGAGASAESAQRLASILSNYLFDMGISPILLAVAAGADDLREITPDDAANWHVTNDPRLPTEWQLSRHGNGIIATAIGQAESEETDQVFDLSLSIYCNSQTTGDLHLLVKVELSGQSPLSDNETGDFCGLYSIGIREKDADNDLVSAECQDHQYDGVKGLIFEASYNAENALIVSMTITKAGAEVINSRRDLSLGFHPSFQSARRSLAEYTIRCQVALVKGLLYCCHAHVFDVDYKGIQRLSTGISASVWSFALSSMRELGDFTS